MAWFKTGGGGNARIDRGTVTWSTTNTAKVTLGYQPSYVKLFAKKDSNHVVIIEWDNTTDSSRQYISSKNGTSSNSMAIDTMPSSANNRIKSIDADGFTVNTASTAAITAYGSTLSYLAIKE